MPVTDQERADVLNFEDFRDAVGESDYMVRLALAGLGLEPLKRGRFTEYKAEWIAPVQAWARRKRGE